MPISDLPPLSDELILGLLAKESSSRADNAAILEYFNEHPDLAERSAFCKHCYKQIYTYLFVDDNTVGFIRHDMYLELWEGNYLTKEWEERYNAKRKAKMEAAKAAIRAEDMEKGIFTTVSQLPRQEPRKATLPASAAV